MAIAGFEQSVLFHVEEGSGTGKLLQWVEPQSLACTLPQYCTHETYPYLATYPPY